MSEPRSLVRNASDPQQVKKAGKKEKLRRLGELSDMKKVLSTLEGRRFVWRYLERCNVFARNYAGDPNTVYYNEGRRDVGLDLIADIMEADRFAFPEMMKAFKGRNGEDEDEK